jgi:hypothetical protein
VTAHSTPIFDLPSYKDQGLKGARMSLNIKNHQTYELVKELAVMKGLSLTSAVTIAVQNEIDREKAAREKAQQTTQPKRSELLMAFAKEYSKRVKNPIHSWEVDALLYGEDGLPK